MSSAGRTQRDDDLLAIDVLAESPERGRAPHRRCDRGHQDWIETPKGWRCRTCRKKTNSASEKRRAGRATPAQREAKRKRVAADWWANHEKRLRQHRAAWKLRKWKEPKS